MKDGNFSKNNCASFTKSSIAQLAGRIKNPSHRLQHLACGEGAPTRVCANKVNISALPIYDRAGAANLFLAAETGPKSMAAAA